MLSLRIRKLAVKSRRHQSKLQLELLKKLMSWAWTPHGNTQGILNSQNLFQEMNKVGWLKLPISETSYKARGVRGVSPRHRDRLRAQKQTRHSNWPSMMVPRQLNRESTIFSRNGAGKTGHPGAKNKAGPLLTSCTKLGVSGSKI